MDIDVGPGAGGRSKVHNVDLDGYEEKANLFL